MGTLTQTEASTGRWRLTLAGAWTMGEPPANLGETLARLAVDNVTGVDVDGTGLTDWDSVLVAFLKRLREVSRSRRIDLQIREIPPGAQRMFDLAFAVTPPPGSARPPERAGVLTELGNTAIAVALDLKAQLTFTGEVVLAGLKLLSGRARFPWRDLLGFFQDCGPKALGIVTLISFLVGLILAFVGAIQLRMFGAQIYVADLVGIGMVRELGAIMTGIVMAGRTGAAYAAQLGTMQVNDEVDAFRTLGVSPVEYLVLPRLIALVVAMPLLCMYANVMGVLGGLVVAVFMLRLGLIQYWTETLASIRLADLWIGLFMSVVFGFLVAGAGCLRGMQCGRSSAAVGRSTTSAVVTGIVSIVVATAIITVLCDILGI